MVEDGGKRGEEGGRGGKEEGGRGGKEEGGRGGKRGGGGGASAKSGRVEETSQYEYIDLYIDRGRPGSTTALCSPTWPNGYIH
jgi:hypothetical protein